MLRTGRANRRASVLAGEGRKVHFARRGGAAPDPDCKEQMETSRAHRPIRPLPNFIFMSRWLQAPLYVGLIIAQGVYVYRFMVELWHLAEGVIADPTHIEEATIMLSVLGLIDVVMIANLLIMVIVGGYETFVSRLELEGHPDQPEWLSHVNAGVLKVKLATAIIGISSIHLLKTFINAPSLDDKTLMWQTLIHLAFVVSALAIAMTERLTHVPQGAH